MQRQPLVCVFIIAHCNIRISLNTEEESWKNGLRKILSYLFFWLNLPPPIYFSSPFWSTSLLPEWHNFWMAGWFATCKVIVFLLLLSKRYWVWTLKLSSESLMLKHVKESNVLCSGHISQWSSSVFNKQTNITARVS